MKKNWKKLMLMTLCTTALLAACGGKEKEKEAGAAYDENSAAEISWLNILHTASPPTDTVLDELQERTNTTIKFSWIPDASKEERINTSLASDSLADMVTLTMLDNSSVRNALKSGMFWDVEEYLDAYPNLKEISAETIASASIEGKLYGVPFQKDLARNGVIIRQDWLDKLGLKAPTTTDELLAVAKAFTLDDPDGNGVADTTGFVDRSDLIYGAFKTLGSYMGVPNGWSVDKSGKMTPEFATEAYVESMDYMKELYDNSYINKDFAVTAKTDQQQNFAQGKAGIYVGALFDSKNLLNMSKGIQDEMELALVNNMTSTGKEEDRAIWAGNNGIGGLLAFPKSEVKDEAELKRILKFVDDLMTEENYALMTYGLEDVHYTIDGEQAVTITDTALWQQEVQPFASSRPNETGFKIHDADLLKQEADRLIAENAEFAVMNPAYALESETNTAQGSELSKIITDATYKYMLGEIKLADFEKAVENWKNSGGQTIITEYETAYKALNK